MRQYNEIKRNYPDSILFFRLGDFYEMFGEDAIVASRTLQIALTTRDRGKEAPVPMCGVPYFTADTYIAKMIKAGYKVALCEQVEDPREAKGIVKREVVNVFTPGTFSPEDPRENNYIMSFFLKENLIGIAVADITTGEFLVYESIEDLRDEISRFEPKEILLPLSLKNNQVVADNLDGFYLTPYDDLHFDYLESYRALLKHFRVVSLEGYGCEGMVVAVSAAGALINYLENNQKGNLSFKKINVLRRASCMFLDAVTLRNLEITRNVRDGDRNGSLLSILDETITPMGGRLLRAWLHRPLIELTEIKLRQDAIDALLDNKRYSKLRGLLKGISDIERLASRISFGSANARDLLSLKASLKIVPEIKQLLVLHSDNLLCDLNRQIDEFFDTVNLIESAIADNPPISLKDGGLIKTGFTRDVDELRQISGSARDFIASIEAKERQRTGINSLKVGYNRIFGYYIEITKANLSQVPTDYTRKQTLAGGERFITPELKEYEAKVLGAEDRLKNLEYEIFQEVRLKISGETERLQRAAISIATLDVLSSLAHVAEKYNYARPLVDDGDTIHITEGRHPVLERMHLGERFVPNNALLDSGDNNILVITGPNMAGKSTYMRQIALIILMAQIGSFVPAENARIGYVDRIYTRIGASDVITKGQSTFMVEMTETANILNNATERSLIILDEVGRGTSTFDGISIAWAVAEYIARQIKARTLFATHYHELTELALVLNGVKNFNIAVKEWGDEIIFFRKIEEGPTNKSYGIQVARLAGLPEDILERAKEILYNLERAELNELGAPKIAYSPHAVDKSRTFGTGFRKNQLDLFTTQPDPVIKELLGLDILNLTPMEALNKLYEMRRKLSDKPK